MNNLIKAAVFLLPACALLGCSSKKPATLTRLRGEAPETIFVSGEFHAPGKYPWTNGMTLRDAIDAAGGFNEYARRKFYLKHWDDTQQTFWLSLDRTITNNPALEPGDQLQSPKVTPAAP